MIRRLALIAPLAVFLLFAGSIGAQDWKTATTLPGVDLSGLTPAQQASVLRVMRAQGCPCPCDLRLAECRVKDPGCPYSKGMSGVVISSIKAGKSEQAAFDAAKASQWGHVAEEKLLEDAVSIPINGSPVQGHPDAKITIVEFSDFQCPYCILAVPQLDAALRAYPTQVKLIFKQFPLEFHSHALLAASASLAANKQGKFWQMHNAMFEHHNDLNRAIAVQVAQGLGLDIARFEKDMDSAEIKQAIEKDVSDGDHAGVQGTPTIFINGQRYNGPITLADLKPILDSELKSSPKPQTAQR